MAKCTWSSTWLRPGSHILFMRLERDPCQNHPDHGEEAQTPQKRTKENVVANRKCPWYTPWYLSTPTALIILLVTVAPRPVSRIMTYTPNSSLDKFLWSHCKHLKLSVSEDESIFPFTPKPSQINVASLLPTSMNVITVHPSFFSC